MEKMSPRERVLTALNHKEPDRVPLDLGGRVTTITKVPYEELKKYLGITSETKLFIRSAVDPPEELLQRFSIDTRYVRLKPPKNFKIHLDPDNSYLDEWGVRWRRPESSLYWDPVDPPLRNATLKDLETYPWPNPDDPGRTEGLREEVKRLREGTDYAIIADVPWWGMFEWSWVALRGPQFLMDMVIDKPFARALIDKLLDLYMKLYGNYLDAVGDYIDVIFVMDDLGGENGPLISPELYREMIKPAHKKLWGSIKSRTKARLFLHSCGSIAPFIHDLADVGIDILNPVQVAAKGMDSKKLKTDFGNRVTFWGGIDTQRVLPMGSPQDVEAEVKKRIRDFAPGGGYILTAVHNIQAGVPPENIVMMYDAAKKYGKYPIQL